MHEEYVPIAELKLQIERALPSTADQTWQQVAARRALLECISTLGSLLKDPAALSAPVAALLDVACLQLHTPDPAASADKTGGD